MITAERIIQLFDMKLLPGEGGYYSETYRSRDRISKDSLPSQYDEDKSLGTAIYYLLTPDTQSYLHRLKSDEVYHFYLGDPVMMLQLRPEGTTKMLFLGQDIRAGQFVQTVVPAGVWQGSFLLEGGSFALMGTTVAPGFDFSDHELGSYEELAGQYPGHEDIIRRLTPSD